MGKRLKVRADALEWRKVEEEVVAIDLRRSEYLGINRTGAKLWPALVAGATAEELERALADEYAVNPAQVRSDVAAFVAALEELGLLAE